MPKEAAFLLLTQAKSGSMPAPRIVNQYLTEVLGADWRTVPAVPETALTDALSCDESAADRIATMRAAVDKQKT